MKKITVLLALLLMIGLVSGCSQQAPQNDEPKEPEVVENANGVVGAAEWEEQYPEIYASYLKNDEEFNEVGQAFEERLAEMFDFEEE